MLSCFTIMTEIPIFLRSLTIRNNYLFLPFICFHIHTNVCGKVYKSVLSHYGINLDAWWCLILRCFACILQRIPMFICTHFDILFCMLLYSGSLPFNTYLRIISLAKRSKTRAKNCDHSSYRCSLLSINYSWMNSVIRLHGYSPQIIPHPVGHFRRSF